MFKSGSLNQSTGRRWVLGTNCEQSITQVVKVGGGDKAIVPKLAHTKPKSKQKFQRLMTPRQEGRGAKKNDTPISESLHENGEK